MVLDVIAIARMRAFTPPPPPKPTLLPLEVRKTLHRLGLKRIRQSNVAAGRECPNKLVLSIRDQTVMSVHALFGSVFHLLFLDIEMTKRRHTDPGFYVELFMIAKAADPHTRYHYRGTELFGKDIKEYGRRFASTSRTGRTLGELAIELHNIMTMNGYDVVAKETPLVYVDGEDSEYPVTLHGTMDLDLYLYGKRVQGDIKSGGLWDVYLEDKGGVKAMSYSPVQVQYHPQLMHYDWLKGLMVPGYRADLYALLFPVNLVPYKDEKRAGERRGLPIVMAPARGAAGIGAYQHDTVAFFKSFTGPHGQYRSMPTNFGSPLCPTCPYFKHCLADTASAGTADALASPEYDYLRQ